MKMHAFLINILYLKVFLECYKYFLNCFEVEFPSWFYALIFWNQVNPQDLKVGDLLWISWTELT